MGSPEKFEGKPSKLAPSFMAADILFDSTPVQFDPILVQAEGAMVSGLNIKTGDFQNGGMYAIKRSGRGDESTYEIMWGSNNTPHYFQANLNRSGLTELCIRKESDEIIKEWSVDRIPDKMRREFRAQGDVIITALINQVRPNNLRMNPHPLLKK